MRETIPIYVRVDPKIARATRAKAIESGIALSAFVENALRLALEPPNAKTKNKAK